MHFVLLIPSVNFSTNEEARVARTKPVETSGARTTVGSFDPHGPATGDLNVKFKTRRQILSSDQSRLLTDDSARLLRYVSSHKIVRLTMALFVSGFLLHRRQVRLEPAPPDEHRTRRWDKSPPAPSFTRS